MQIPYYFDCCRLGDSDGVRAPTEDGLDIGVEVSTSDIMEDKEEFEVEANEPEEISDDESEDKLDEDESEAKSGEE
nr:hypothetical protein [Tanacetum cinerariifolium]